MINYIKNNYKTFIPLLVFLVLLLTIFIFYRQYRYDNYRNKETLAVYKEILGDTVEFKVNLFTNKDKALMEIKPINKTITTDSNPIYYKDKLGAIFASEMSIIFPLEGNKEYRINKNSIYEKVGNLHYLTNQGIKKDYLYFFLYDGDDLYFFTTPVTIKINDKDYKTVGEMSYIKLVDNTLIYYDKESNTSEVVELNNEDIIVYNDIFSLNIRTDRIGNNKLLTKKLSALTNINKKAN